MSAVDSYEAPEMGGAATVPTPVTHTASEFHYGAGADANTLNIMMGVTLAGYALLLSVMMMACVCRRNNSGFTRFDMEATTQQQKEGPVSELDAMWRKAFIGKVYSILGIQLFVTVSVSFVMMQFGGARLMMWLYTSGSWTHMVSIVALFVSLCALMCNRHKYPRNLILLSVFTLTMSWFIGTTCTMYAARGLSALVVEAFAITSIIFIALTLFTVQSKIDFSFLGVGLSAALFGFLIWGCFAMFAFPSFMFSQVYALIGALIFSLYVVYDTWVMTSVLSYDEHILAAVNLYLDFINLFLMILRLLSGGARE